MSKGVLWCASPCLLAIFACASAPFVERKEPRSDYVPAQWASVFVESEETQNGWVVAYHDPGLAAFVVEAMAGSPQVEELHARVSRSRGLQKQAHAKLRPVLNFGTEVAHSGSFDSEKAATTSLSFRAAWETDLFGQTQWLAESSDFEMMASRAEYRAGKMFLAGAVAEAYFLAIEAQLQVAVARRTLESLHETLGFVKIQYDRGMRSGLDIALIQADAVRAESALHSAINAHRDAMRGVEILLGRYPSAGLSLRKDLPDVPPAPSMSVPAKLLQRRPDLIAAVRRIDSVNAMEESRRAELLPSLRLLGGLGARESNFRDLLNPAQVVWDLGASIFAPILDGGSREAAIEIAHADVEIALAAFRAAALGAFEEVERQLDLGVTLKQQEILLHQALLEAEKALQYARFSYESGQNDLLDVLSIQQRVSSLESRSVSLQRARLVQYASLAMALGGNWEL